MLDASRTYVGLAEARRRIAKAVSVAISAQLLLGGSPQLIVVSKQIALRELARRNLDTTIVICELQPSGLCILGHHHG